MTNEGWKIEKWIGREAITNKAGNGMGAAASTGQRSPSLLLQHRIVCLYSFPLVDGQMGPPILAGGQGGRGAGQCLAAIRMYVLELQRLVATRRQLRCIKRCPFRYRYLTSGGFPARRLPPSQVQRGRAKSRYLSMRLSTTSVRCAHGPGDRCYRATKVHVLACFVC